MRNAIAAVATFPPDLDINPAPTGQHDKLVGMGGQFFNTLIQYMNVNVTMVGAKSIGECVKDKNGANVTCDGLAALLATGGADFSVLPMPLNAFIPIQKEFPVHFGPVLSLAEVVFGSSPSRDARVENISILQTHEKMVLTNCLAAVSFLVCFFLINWSVKRAKFRRLYSPCQMWGLTCMKPGPNVRATHRRISLFTSLFLALMNWQILMGTIGSDMVVTIPAKYYETLEEVSASNATPTMRSGAVVDRLLGQSNDPMKRRIFERAVQRKKFYSRGDKSALMAMSQQLNETVPFLSSKVVANVMIGLSCFAGGYYPPREFRFSKPFATIMTVNVYGRSVAPDLRRHVSRFYERIVDSGVYLRYSADVTSTLSAIVDSDLLTLCFVRASRKVVKQSVVDPWSLDYFRMPFSVTTSALMVSAIVLFLEIVCKKSAKKKVLSSRRISKSK